MVKLDAKSNPFNYDIEIKHPEIIIVKDFISQIEQEQILNILNSLEEDE